MLRARKLAGHRRMKLAPAARLGESLALSGDNISPAQHSRDTRGKHNHCFSSRRPPHDGTARTSSTAARHQRDLPAAPVAGGAKNATARGGATIRQNRIAAATFPVEVWQTGYIITPNFCHDISSVCRRSSLAAGMKEIPR
jgi:hypothetical protein